MIFSLRILDQESAIMKGTKLASAAPELGTSTHLTAGLSSSRRAFRQRPIAPRPGSSRRADARPLVLPQRTISRPPLLRQDLPMTKTVWFAINRRTGSSETAS